MKKILPYILLGVVLGAAAILVFTAKNDKVRKLDERLTLRKNDKIPYGTFVAHKALQNFFPDATVTTSFVEPGFWENINRDSDGQAIVIISPQFFANLSELERLISFAKTGNDVFISAGILSEDAQNVFACGTSFFDVFDIFGQEMPGLDTMEISLSNPPFKRSYKYEYPGRKFSGHFYRYDSSTSTVLGRGESGRVNFIHLKAGDGNVYVHLSPIAFSNYFLLKGNNVKYYEDILSLLDPDTKTILWDEYFLRKTSYSENKNKKGWFRTFMQYESLSWGLMTAILALLVYTLLEMRRKQRPIPVMKKPVNDSMDFVKTIGRLYYDRRDHRNLTRKMAAYFMEYVRNRFKISTTQLNEDFIVQLQEKTGIHSGEIRNIVSFIKDMEGVDQISDKQLEYFHKQLESFYNKS